VFASPDFGHRSIAIQRVLRWNKQNGGPLIAELKTALIEKYGKEQKSDVGRTYAAFQADVRWREELTWVSNSKPELAGFQPYIYRNCDHQPSFYPLSWKSRTSDERVFATPNQARFFDDARKHLTWCGTVVRGVMLAMPSQRETAIYLAVSAIDYSLAGRQGDAASSNAEQRRMEEIKRGAGAVPRL
jgi:hypothetical protein